MSTPVYIVSACRTAIGSLQGQFSNVPATDLGATTIQYALERANILPNDVSEVVMGQVLTAGQGQNPARQSAIKAKIPYSVPAHTVNMVCGSGLKAVHYGYLAIKTGEANIIVAGGQENMSQARHCAYIRSGVKLGSAQLEDSILTDGLIDATLKIHMGNTAEQLATRFNVSRADQDEFALNSQKKAAEAVSNMYFEKEIVPVVRKNVPITKDEHPRPNVTTNELSKLRPVFVPESGTVTAGNASGINDGAAAVVLCNALEVESRKLKPLAIIVACAQVALDPIDMGLGPIGAVKTVLEKAKWSVDDVDVFELNEAFAVQSLLVIQELKLNPDKVNISGGAIALGHPIGASGARILVTLIYNLKRIGKTKGVAALCIGGGMGIAMAIEVV